MIGGPRLDTPSAVGDEGRPRATSLTITALIVTAFALATGTLSGTPRLFTGIALLSGVSVAGMTLLDRERLGPTVIGHLCFLSGATGVLASLIMQPVNTALGVGVVLAMIGVATGWTNVFDSDTIASTTVSSVVSYLFAVVGLVGSALAVAGMWLCWEFLTTATGGTSPMAAVLGLGVLTAVASACLYLAVAQLPLLQLTARSRRNEMEATLARVKGLLRMVALLSGSFTVVVPFALVLTSLEQVLATPPVSVVLRVLASWLVFAPLLAVTIVALLAGMGAIGVRKFTTEFDSSSVRTVGAAIAAVGYMLLLMPVIVSARSITVFFGALLLPLAVYLILVLTLGVLKLGMLPERAAPAALTAAGLVCASIGAAQAGLPALLVFSGVVGGLVAWDVDTFGLGLTAELGHRPETRRLELYHGVFAVGVGLLGILIFGAVEIARQTVGTAVGSPETMAIAVIGVLLLLAPLRG
ncbi:MAG: glycosyl transferase [Haloarcula sp.]